jgi:4-amino-4-deoxy-L-arabinose transferase-like glycosyltransferase
MVLAASQLPTDTPRPPQRDMPRAGDDVDAEDLERRLDSSSGLKPAVWILVISALVMRLAAIAIMGDWSHTAAAEYGSLAASLLQGEGFALNETADYTQHGIYEPSSFRPPVYPLLLAGLYAVFGVKSAAAHMAALLLNALAGAATAGLSYRMVRQIGGQHATALLAALLLAFWPTQLLASAMVNPITLVTLAVIGSVLLWNRSVESRGQASWLWFSLVASLLALTEPALLPALGLAPLAILLHSSLPVAIRLRNAVLVAGVALLVLGPWTYRNWRVHHALVPVTSTFWLNMWMGNNPNATGTDALNLTAEQLARFQALGSDRLRQTDLLSDAQRQHLDGRRAMEREAVWKAEATRFIRDNPWRYFELCQIRLARTVWADWDHPRGRDPVHLYFISRGLLLAFTLLGLFRVTWAGCRFAWPAILLGTCIIVHTLTITSARAAIPMEVLQMPVVALALFSIWQAARARRQRPPMVRRFMGEINDGTSPDALALERRSKRVAL